MPQEVCRGGREFDPTHTEQVHTAAATAGALFQAPIFGFGRPRFWRKVVAGVVEVIEPAPLQFRNDVVHEIGVAAGHVRRRHHKPVAGALDEHALELIGDGLGIADDRAVGLAAIVVAQEIAHRRILSCRSC